MPPNSRWKITPAMCTVQVATTDTLLKVLQLIPGKFEVTEVFDLFENPELGERWSITGTDLEDLRSWVIRLGVHWGVNAADHEAHCGVAFDEFSWEPALDRLLLETDCPFMAPEPFRGKRNDPGYLFRMAERLAEIRGISVEEVHRITTENAKALYRIV